MARFAKLLPEYAAPEITRERLYIETMEKALGNTRKVLVNDKGGNLMVLPLDQMLKGGNAPAAKSDNGASNLLRLPPPFLHNQWSKQHVVHQSGRYYGPTPRQRGSVTTTSVRGNNDA